MANAQNPLYRRGAKEWMTDPRSNPEWFYDRIKHLTMGELANLARTLPQFAPQLGLSQDEVWDYLDIINRVSGGQVSPYAQAAGPAAGPQGGVLPGTQTAPPVQPVQATPGGPVAPVIPVTRTDMQNPRVGQGQHGKRPGLPLDPYGRGALAQASGEPDVRGFTDRYGRRVYTRPEVAGQMPGLTEAPPIPEPTWSPSWGRPSRKEQSPAIPPPTQPEPEKPAPEEKKPTDYAGMSMEDFMKNGEVFYISINGHGLRRDEGGQFVPTR